jgi:hypothetical protein
VGHILSEGILRITNHSGDVTISRAHGPAWRQSAHLSLGQLKVMSAIEQCRSATRCKSHHRPQQSFAEPQTDSPRKSATEKFERSCSTDSRRSMLHSVNGSSRHFRLSDKGAEIGQYEPIDHCSGMQTRSYLGLNETRAAGVGIVFLSFSKRALSKTADVKAGQTVRPSDVAFHFDLPYEPCRTLSRPAWR